MAAATATAESVIKFYTAWFCPYAQRTWIALNHLKLKYELIESLKFDETSKEYIKNETLLQLNPKGLVPTLDVNGEAVVESIDTIEYLHKYSGGQNVNFVTPDLVNDAHVMNTNVCSPFYRLLMKQEKSEQDAAWEEFVSALKIFAENIQVNGYFKSSDSMNIVDITLFPWANRLSIVELYREKYLDKNLQWVQNFHTWYERMLADKDVQNTVADKDKMIEIYSRYAKGVAKSKVADAVRSGKEAHDIE